MFGCCPSFLRMCHAARRLRFGGGGRKRSAANLDRMRRLGLHGHLRQMHREDAVLVVGRGFRLVDAVDVERAAHAARAALAADVVALVILFVMRRLVLRADRQVVVLVRQLDVFLLHAGEFGREVVARAVVLDVDLEIGRVEVREERLVKDVHHAIEHIVVIRAECIF